MSHFSHGLGTKGWVGVYYVQQRTYAGLCAENGVGADATQWALLNTLQYLIVTLHNKRHVR